MLSQGSRNQNLQILREFLTAEMTDILKNLTDSGVEDDCVIFKVHYGMGDLILIVCLLHTDCYQKDLSLTLLSMFS